MAPIEKEGYWTPFEKQVRDYILLPITWPFKFIPYAANILTITGFGILFYAIYDFYLLRDFERQIWLLTWAWLTDFLDGPIARNNNNVTALGTAMDHIRDYFIGFWMIVLIFFITEAHPDYWMINWLIVLTIIGLLGVIAGTILFQREMRKESAPVPYLKFLHDFLLQDLVTSVTARIHTVVLAVAGVLYIAGVTWGELYSRIGIVLLLIQLFILGFYNHEIHQARYEDKSFKIHKKMQEKIGELEDLLDRIKKTKFKRTRRSFTKLKNKIAP